MKFKLKYLWVGLLSLFLALIPIQAWTQELSPFFGNTVDKVAFSDESLNIPTPKWHQPSTQANYPNNSRSSNSQHRYRNSSGFDVGVIAIVSLFSGIWMFQSSWFRESCKQPDYYPQKNKKLSLDIYETAYLAGGKERVVQTAIATLVKCEYLQPRPATQSLKIIGSLPSNSHPLERAIASAPALQKNTRFSLSIIELQVTRYTQRIHDRLKALNLLVNPEQTELLPLSKLPVLQMLVMTCLFVLCVAVVLAVFMAGGWIGGLILSVFIGAGFFHYLSESLHRTQYGDRILANLQTQHTNLKAQALDSGSQVAQAFALFGTEILTKNRLQGLKQILRPLSSSGGHGSGPGGGGSG
ncbi:MAG: TIGR04222 domain-containing membrane protein [Cyanobacteriota bacterium]|nr:TIGR04222 domain-containing membrane protein [Cyanobacteriota bacterium]